MRRVQVIEAQKEKIDRNTGRTINKARVAAYCCICQLKFRPYYNRKLGHLG